METLKMIEADIPDDSQLLISHVKTKLEDDRITDTHTLKQVQNVIASLINTIPND